ncbi:hypothetical protein GW17_00026847, partial [Ensete ventricosum]
EEGEEKPGVVLLFPRAIHRLRVISSPAGDFFSPRGEKKRLPAWGEGTRWRTVPYRAELGMPVRTDTAILGVIDIILLLGPLDCEDNNS